MTRHVTTRTETQCTSFTAQDEIATILKEYHRFRDWNDACEICRNKLSWNSQLIEFKITSNTIEKYFILIRNETGTCGIATSCLCVYKTVSQSPVNASHASGLHFIICS